MIRWESVLVVGVVLAVAASCTTCRPLWDRDYQRDQARQRRSYPPAIYRELPLDRSGHVRVV